MLSSEGRFIARLHPLVGQCLSCSCSYVSGGCASPAAFAAADTVVHAGAGAGTILLASRIAITNSLHPAPSSPSLSLSLALSLALSLPVACASDGPQKGRFKRTELQSGLEARVTTCTLTGGAQKGVPRGRVESGGRWLPGACAVPCTCPRMCS